MSELLNKLKKFIFPSKCIACNDIIMDGDCLCENCMDKWEKEKHAKCNKCGKEHIKCVCPIKYLKSNISCIIHLAEYKNDSIAQKLAFRIKNRPSEDALNFIAKEIYSLLCERDDYKDAIVTFVPRREKVIIETGCDQAKDIAEIVAAFDGREVFSLLTRKGNKAQKEMNADERQKNVEKSYFFKDECRDDINGKTIFIIDDIITTGTTVNYCAELFIQNGAAKVNAVSLARRT